MGTYSDAARDTAASLRGRDELVGLELVIEQHVELADDVEIYHLVIRNGSVEVLDGVAPHADVVIEQDAETAEALRSGTTHAQTAFLTGRLSISGDVDKLVEARDALVALVRTPDA